MEVSAGQQPNNEHKIKAKIRLDFKGVAKPGRLFFGGKTTDRVAEEVRDSQVAYFRNVPRQGVHIDDIDMSLDIYTVFDEDYNAEVAYAPVNLLVTADSLEDTIPFIAREEFRMIEILEPAQLTFSRYGVERLLFRINEEMREYRQWLEKRYSNK